jgi:hypothetical protein
MQRHGNEALQANDVGDEGWTAAVAVSHFCSFAMAQHWIDCAHEDIELHNADRQKTSTA